MGGRKTAGSVIYSIQVYSVGRFNSGHFGREFQRGVANQVVSLERKFNVWEPTTSSLAMSEAGASGRQDDASKASWYRCMIVQI